MDSQTVQRFLDGMKYEAERTAPPDGFPSFPDIPAGRYVDPEFLKPRSAASGAQLAVRLPHRRTARAPAASSLWKKTGSPILIVRGKDDVIRAFYNTCRHRGAPLVKDELRQGRRFRLRLSRLDLRAGRQAGEPARQARFRRPRHGAHRWSRCAASSFANWVFINEDPERRAAARSTSTRSRHNSSSSSPRQLALRRKAGYRRQVQRQGAARRVPRGLSPEVDPPEHGRPLPRSSRHHDRAVPQRPFADGHAEPPPGLGRSRHEGMRRVETATEISRQATIRRSTSIPNLVTPVDPTGCPFLLFWPTGRDTMRIECHWFAPDWGGGEPQPAVADAHRELRPHPRRGPAVRRADPGVGESPGFRGMTLNYQERRIYHWHEELDRRIGAERDTRQQLRVPAAARAVLRELNEMDLTRPGIIRHSAPTCRGLRLRARSHRGRDGLGDGRRRQARKGARSCLQLGRGCLTMAVEAGARLR